jgi:hypothetical protein
VVVGKGRATRELSKVIQVHRYIYLSQSKKYTFKNCGSQIWWHTLVIPALRRPRRGRRIMSLKASWAT